MYKRQDQQRAQQEAQKQEQQRAKQQAQQQDQQRVQQEAQKQEQQRVKQQAQQQDQQRAQDVYKRQVLVYGYGRIYLFQIAQPLKVGTASAGRECFLNPGDLLGFASLPASPVAEMKVVASGANSCLPGELVQVHLTDLQGMLDGFSVRVKDNMTRVSACAAPGRC